MELRQFQYFVECARNKSFSQAAKKLYTTQPNISRAMQRLEEELQVSLFKRNNLGIELTREGEIVYYYATEILGNVERMIEQLDSPPL